MKKDRDFLDYVSVGSHLLQNLQLSDLQNSVAVLGGAEAQRLRSEQVENQIRQFVFESSQTVRKLRETYLVSAPTGTLLTALNLENILRANGITTARVRSFEDKERLQQLLDQTNALIKEAEERMDTSTREAVRKAAAFKAEELDFQKLLALMAEHEGITKLRTEYEALPRKSAMPPFLALFLIVAATFALTILLRQTPSITPTVLSGVILSLLFLILGVIGLIPSKPHGAYKLKLKIKESEDAFLMRDSAVELRRLRNRFGDDRDLAGYRELQAERQRQIDKFLCEPIPS